ncbi:MAG: hypothetical protein JW772_00530 [Candidatus Diapherotrites archaeon]|nr:hypothetical protein [Candidatus Diapherotrites archaeon]
MGEHDSNSEVSSAFKEIETLRKISPEYNDLTADIQEIMEQSKNPQLVAVLLFKLAKEREKTNEMMAKINEKFDSIMFKLKTAHLQQEPSLEAEQIQGQSLTELDSVPLKALPEQDQHIVHLAFEKGQVSAEDVKRELGYKGKNAASQRLNKLFREGHLKKIQAGKKVVYLARNL